jgi:hypothetical protein
MGTWIRPINDGPDAFRQYQRNGAVSSGHGAAHAVTRNSTSFSLSSKIYALDSFVTVE